MNIHDDKTRRRGPSPFTWWDKLSAAAFLLVTPEYAAFKRAQRTSLPTAATFGRPAPMPLGYKTIASVRVRYAHAARPDAPTVILLGPLPQSIVAFAPLWERFVSSFNLFAYDLPGFGGSEGGVEFMSFAAQGRFLRDFIAEFGIRRPHLVGPDIGMGAALAYVAEHENEVASLMIGDGPGIAPSQNGSIIRKMANSCFWRFIVRTAGAGAFVYAGGQLGYLNYVPNSAELHDYVSAYAGRVGQVTQWFKNYPTSIAAVDGKLAELDKPVLIFWGDQDQFLMLENAHMLGRRIQRSRVHVFAHCGHFSYQDKHEEFGRLTLDWVGGAHAAV